MKFIPKKNNNALGMAVASVATGLVLMLLSDRTPISPFILQIIAIALFTLSIQLIQRYHLSDFQYLVDDMDNGDAIISVVRIQGKKISTVCSIAASNCIYGGDKSGFSEKTVNSFDYRQNIFSSNDFILIYKDRTGYITIKLEPDEAFKAGLISRINMQK